MAKNKWVPGPELTPEEVGKMLDEREGGRKAGRGDSPYTQEYYEELYGIKKENTDQEEKKSESESVWEPIKQYTDEEIGKMLDEREGGRKAGRGDSPYTQEYYEELYGIKKEKKQEEKE